MWHEARKQEKKIRGMIVDYRKRADRRKEFYEKIRADPIQFLQLHGRKCKIHYDVTDVTEETHMMKWQGQGENLIDRFDVRAHLDYIPPLRTSKEPKESEMCSEDRFINYERFRILAQNEFLGVTEESFLKQLQIFQEQFGVTTHQVENDKGKKKNSQASAAIGYNYDDSSSTPTIPFSQTIQSIETSTTSNRYDEFAKDYSDESDMDVDVSIDINKIGTQEAHELNNCGKRYGMMTNDFFSYLTKDEDEKQSMKAIKEQEADKIIGGGRKSRRERRSQRERRILGKPLSPPSYAAKEEKKETFEEEEEEDDKSSRNSKSLSPEKITYITSFGGEEELKPHPKISIKLKQSVKLLGPSKSFRPSYAEQVRQNLDKLKKINKYEKKSRKSRSTSTDRRRDSRSRSRRRRESSRSTSNSRRYRSRSTSGSRRRGYSSRSYSSDSRRRTRSSRSYSKSSYSSYNSRTPHRKLPYSRKRSSSSRDKSTSRRKNTRSRSISKKRSYSTSSSSSRRSTSFSSSRYTISSPEKRSRRMKSSSRDISSKKKSSSKERKLEERLTMVKKSPRRKETPSLRPQLSNRDKILSRKSNTREKSLRKFSSSPEKRRKSKSVSIDQSSSSQTPVASSSDAAPIKRYYGRRRDDDSSDSLSVVSESDDEKKTGSNQSSANEVAKVKPSNRSAEFKIGLSRSTVGGPTISNPREKLKKKMQLLLNKQYKADKKAETERIERQIQQQQERDEEMRELALKLRRKQRELRHKYGDTQDSKTESESDVNESGTLSGNVVRKKRRSRSSSSSSSSSSSDKSRHKRQKRAKKPVQSIARSPVRYSRRSTSESSGRNRRYTRSRSSRR